MKKINRHQQLLYEQWAAGGCAEHVQRFARYLEYYADKQELRILDIGGATGDFAYGVKRHFADASVQAYVVDPATYATWAPEALGKEVQFICDSSENLEKRFPPKSFDLIFANRVIHHFVQAGWRESLAGIEGVMCSVRKILKDDGLFCIMDHFYDGRFVDCSSSFLVHAFTSIKNPTIAALVKRMGAESAGVGTCFLSEKMWMERLAKTGFEIRHIERTQPDRMTLAKALLMFKSASRDNIIIAAKKNLHARDAVTTINETYTGDSLCVDSVQFQRRR